MKNLKDFTDAMHEAARGGFHEGHKGHPMTHRYDIDPEEASRRL